VKDYMKVIITALITALVTLTVSGVFTQNQRINASATKDDLKEVKKESFAYTDDEIKKHAEVELVRYVAIKEKTDETYSMVKYLYELEINRK